MNLSEAYEYGKKELSDVGIAEADIDAWYLLEFVTGVTRATYFMDRTKGLAKDDKEAYLSCIAKRSRHIPLQHITGEQEFMGYTFKVNQNVLVPRQDTEVLVETVLRLAKPHMRILDMCTGSGCILLSLMKLIPNLIGVGADLSEDALAVAKENAKRLAATPTFIKSDLFDAVEGTYDVIVSNPPYIPTREIEKLEAEVRLHDPMMALDGSEDGLLFYRRIVDSAGKYINNGGYLCFEIGHDQGMAVRKLMEDAGYQKVTVKKDLAGLDRVVFGVYNT